MKYSAKRVVAMMVVALLVLGTMGVALSESVNAKTAVQSNINETQEKTATAKAEIKVFKKARTSSAVLTTLEKGETVKVVGKKGKFSKIKTDDVTGFVLTKKLKMKNPAAQTKTVNSVTVKAKNKETNEVTVTKYIDIEDEPIAKGLNIQNVDFTIEANSVVRLGDTVLLRGTLAGFENTEYQLQWLSSNDGVNWSPVPGATGITHSFQVSRANFNTRWMLTVNTAAIPA